MNIPGSLYVYDRTLRLPSGRLVGPFSSHWAACAAMLRLSEPGFRSLGGDKEKDLELERTI